MKGKYVSFVLCGGILLFLCSFAHAQSGLMTQKLDVGTLEKLLSKGRKMMLIEGDVGKFGERVTGMIVNASPDKCMNVIMDVESYKEFVPMMTESKVTTKKGNEVTADFTVDVKFLGIGCTEKFSQKNVLKKEQKIIEVLDDKGKKGGYWKFIPLQGGAKTILLYQDEAPKIENMCWTAKTIVKINKDSELALQVSPPFMFIDAMKKRIEGKK